MLASSRLDALEETQRIEFGDGPALMFTEALASSPLISRENLTDVVAALETAFYQVKDDTLDACPDTEAIEELVAAPGFCSLTRRFFARSPRSAGFFFFKFLRLYMPLYGYV